VAFYAILRYRTIADTVLGPGYTRTLLFIAALSSLAVAATLLIAQRDYKRLLAYSSIEHMGLVTLGTAFGLKLALAAVLLHILGHGIVKAVAFCSAGRILHTTGSPDIVATRGLAMHQPALAATFGVGLIALLGLPPFSLFASELGIARAGYLAGHGWAVAVAFAFVLVAFAAIVRHATRMLLGPRDSPPSQRPTGVGGLAWLGLGLAMAAVLGVYLGPLRPVLDAAAVIAGGH
jgi:hydrogenase-4 component F